VGTESAALTATQVTLDHEKIVAAAVRTIDLSYREPLRIRQLAASVYLSSDRFRQIFAAVMGRTPRDYLRHVRIEHAKALLTTTSLPISGVATATGFGDSAYFARAFREMTGCSPPGIP
jgi:iron complex transport system substrate-binding protein